MSMHKSLQIPFTQVGYDKFKKEFDELVKKRPSVVAELARARDLGDRSENAAYKSARWELSTLDKRLRFLRRLVENAVVVSPRLNETVGIGSIVTVKSERREMKVTIVGEHEAEPMKLRLSYKSPIGGALIGKGVKDIVKVSTPDGDIAYEILKIHKLLK